MKNKPSIGVIIFAVIIILGVVINIIHFSFHGSHPAGESFYPAWEKVFYIFSDLIAIAISMNIFLLREWARKGVIYYQIFSVVCFPIIILLNSKMVYNRLVSQHPHMTQAEIMAGANFGLIASIGSILIFALLIIYFFTRPKVKEQFEP